MNRTLLAALFLAAVIGLAQGRPNNLSAASAYAPAINNTLVRHALESSPFCSESHFGVPHGARKAGSPWSYIGATSAAFWGDLQPDYSACKDGRKQSPVDLSFPATVNRDPDVSINKLVVNWVPLASPVTVSNNGHAFQIDVINNPSGADNYVLYMGVRYNFVQAHFHGPSEHLVEGRHWPLELHCVHLSESGRYLVVGILIDFGENRNVFFDQFVYQIPKTVGSVEINAPLDWSPLLSEVSLDEFYAYDGSFTTPPCTEIVQWIVLKKPVNAARRFIAVHSDIIHFNSRLAQEIYDQLGENDN